MITVTDETLIEHTFDCMLRLYLIREPVSSTYLGMRERCRKIFKFTKGGYWEGANFEERFIRLLLIVRHLGKTDFVWSQERKAWRVMMKSFDVLKTGELLGYVIHKSKVVKEQEERISQDIEKYDRAGLEEDLSKLAKRIESVGQGG